MNNHHDRELELSVRLMEHLVVPTFVLDADCRVIIWNRACERLTGIKAGEVIGSREHWRGFYNEPRPCLADLIAQGRTEEIDALYVDHDHAATDAVPAHGRRAENWCVMPQLGTRLYLAIDSGPIFDETGKLIAVVETLRDMTKPCTPNGRAARGMASRFRWSCSTSTTSRATTTFSAIRAGMPA